jgi:hypothetical protein
VIGIIRLGRTGGLVNELVLAFVSGLNPKARTASNSHLAWICWRVRFGYRLAFPNSSQNNYREGGDDLGFCMASVRPCGESARVWILAHPAELDERESYFMPFRAGIAQLRCECLWHRLC